MTPKAFIVIDGGSVTESVVTGDTNVEVVVLDFDSLEIDAEEARQILVDHGDDLANINGPAGARDLKTRLQDIVDEADAEDFEEEDEEDEDFEDEDDDEDLDLELEEGDEDFEDDIDLGDEDELDAEFDETLDEQDDAAAVAVTADEEDDEKKEEDYNGDEFNEGRILGGPGLGRG